MLFIHGALSLDFGPVSIPRGAEKNRSVVRNVVLELRFGRRFKFGAREHHGQVAGQAPGEPRVDRLGNDLMNVTRHIGRQIAVSHLYTQNPHCVDPRGRLRPREQYEAHRCLPPLAFDQLFHFHDRLAGREHVVHDQDR